MSSTTFLNDYKRILVSVDFSAHAEAALKQAVWLARQSGARITLLHSLPDLRQEFASASLRARLDMVYGDGETFQLEIRKESDRRMKHMLNSLNATDLDVTVETLLGEPFVAVIHAVQKEGHDLVLAGTRGLAAWEQFFVGSTAKRLIRKCPSSVWIVKAQHADPPKAVLAATDFSDVSRRAVREGLLIAQQAGADFHLLHVIDSKDVPPSISEQLMEGVSIRQAIREEAGERLATFVNSLDSDASEVHTHLSSGTPWQEIDRLAKHLDIDLIAMGTVGLGGIKGLLLGNTAEKVLDTCDCSTLTVKPTDYVSPIEPAFWPLHPGRKGDTPLE
jgi:universal stress protein E